MDARTLLYTVLPPIITYLSENETIKSKKCEDLKNKLKRVQQKRAAKPLSTLSFV
jgi:hypothetical protein